MSQGTVCHCNDRAHFVVRHRQHNHSAFNGYHKTYSEYSTIACTVHGTRWRSKAAWVDDLPDEHAGGCSNASY